jgi:hypothetical protein
MANSKQPNIFSIQLADTAAVGHINSGLELYRAFAALPDKPRAPGEQLDVNRVFELGIPAVTNMALGLELLVKVHHFQVVGTYPHGHDIQKLGSTLPEDALANLRAIYKTIHDDPATDKGLELRISGGASGRKPKDWDPVDFSTYDLAIAYVAPMYVKWRYIYEEFQDDVDIRVSFGPLYFLAQTFHQAVRAQKGNTRITMRDGNAAETGP